MNFFKYKIPEKIKSQLTLEFQKDFVENLKSLMNVELTIESFLYAEGTCGWSDSLSKALQKNNLNGILKYYQNLEWYDSDLFDTQLSDLLVENKLIENNL